MISKKLANHIILEEISKINLIYFAGFNSDGFVFQSLKNLKTQPRVYYLLDFIENEVG